MFVLQLSLSSRMVFGRKLLWYRLLFNSMDLGCPWCCVLVWMKLFGRLMSLSWFYEGWVGILSLKAKISVVLSFVVVGVGKFFRGLTYCSSAFNPCNKSDSLVLDLLQTHSFPFRPRLPLHTLGEAYMGTCMLVAWLSVVPSRVHIIPRRLLE